MTALELHLIYIISNYALFFIPYCGCFTFETLVAIVMQLHVVGTCADPSVRRVLTAVGAVVVKEICLASLALVDMVLFTHCKRSG